MSPEGDGGSMTHKPMQRRRNGEVEGKVWVIKNQDLLNKLGLFDELQTEAARYMEQTDYDIRQAGHAAITKVGNRLYKKVTGQLPRQATSGMSVKTFLFYLRGWFNLAGADKLQVELARDDESTEEL
jgi:hypothetical protein